MALCRSLIIIIIIIIITIYIDSMCKYRQLWVLYQMKNSRDYL